MATGSGTPAPLAREPVAADAVWRGSAVLRCLIAAASSLAASVALRGSGLPVNGDSSPFLTMPPHPLPRKPADTAGEITARRQSQAILCIMVELVRAEVLF